MSKARDLANAGTALTNVSATELGYLDGVTSPVQTQISDVLSVANSKAVIQKGTTALRPTGIQGDLYYDTTLDNLYQKNNYGWQVAGSEPIMPISALDILVVAGGGGGATYGGGGAGAGGLLGFMAQPVTTGSTYSITVGAGGASDTNGGNSQFGSLQVVYGGGKGSAGNGGSGGGVQGGTPGSGYAGPPRQGYDGGTAGGYAYNGWPIGGGGGAGGVGGNAPNNSQGGPGGVGVSTYSSWGLATNVGHNVSGTVYFAGGGGGGTYGSDGTNAVGLVSAPGGYGGGGNGNSFSEGTAGLPNTGGGGGAGRMAAGMPGGSGVIIIRYPNTFSDIASISAGLVYTRVELNGFKYYAFKSGTGTVTI